MMNGIATQMNKADILFIAVPLVLVMLVWVDIVFFVLKRPAKGK
jgi:hypothetical protein